jgi:hypothetical protein
MFSGSASRRREESGKGNVDGARRGDGGLAADETFESATFGGRWRFTEARCGHSSAVTQLAAAPQRGELRADRPAGRLQGRSAQWLSGVALDELSHGQSCLEPDSIHLPGVTLPVNLGTGYGRRWFTT